ncbi:uncharacterized protein BT62DRAFT_63504 [Guyanagaster necrorhizus]|uniref:DUF6593 domain-containing protein n=1 Tax=Guyanagaster necrorhizus TaxID=856835 RepID=A0A9P7VVX4_9AGAR|nr:uncharacterized protein BT62DRAFT_63504 [Guyanagaster necrorhizus MCA 3950]KAG7447149.1 hypothetical protein BT62DRAFT_63504 [Guyanagaster necrorhizus MCA 3950]
MSEWWSIVAVLFAHSAEMESISLLEDYCVHNDLAVGDNHIYYEIVTCFWHPTLTKINILNPETRALKTIAEVQKSYSGRHRVRFLAGKYMGEWISSDKFLKVEKAKIGGSFLVEGVGYRWKTHNRRLQLVRSDDETKTPLVVCQPHRRYSLVMLMSRHASLQVNLELANFMDRLIVSYILVERRRRMI